MSVEADRLKDIKKFEAEIATLQAENARLEEQCKALIRESTEQFDRAESAEAQLRDARATALEEYASHLVRFGAGDAVTEHMAELLRARAAAERQESYGTMWKVEPLPRRVLTQEELDYLRDHPVRLPERQKKKP